MPLKKQLLNYFQSSIDAAGNFMYFDKLPTNPLDEIIALPLKNEKEQIPEVLPPIFSTQQNENAKVPFIQIAQTSNKVQARMTSKPIAHTTINRVEINVNTLEELNLLMKKCDKCVLGATRQSVVCGEGNPNADIMVIGEAPGADEDEQGLPFVGRAGKLLTDILKAVNFSREDVFIANICKCRPPANRKPTPLEVHCCEPYLIKQIELIKPKFILALGLTAAEALFKNNPRMLDIRGQILDYYGIKTMVTYHPAALLRNPNWKRPVWEDVQLLRQMYDEEMKQSRTS